MINSKLEWVLEIRVGKNKDQKGSDCVSVGRAVALFTRGPWFEFSHQQIHKEHLFSANYFEKTKIKKMRPCLAHLKKFNMELRIERFDKINTPNE